MNPFSFKRWLTKRLIQLVVSVTVFSSMDCAMAQDRILISSEWGNIAAELIDNAATRSLMKMLPLKIDLRDHLQQEKTGNLPSPLPETFREREFSTGTLGLWGLDDFVIYYQAGKVPSPGIIVLGKVTGDVSIFDRRGPIAVKVEELKP